MWTTASMFFQLALLAGYLYAHLVSQRLSPRHQALLHLALIGAVFAALPFGLDGAPASATARNPLTALLTLLALSLGLPFFAVAATAPPL